MSFSATSASVRSQRQTLVDFRDYAAGRRDQRRDKISHHADGKEAGLRMRPCTDEQDIDPDRPRPDERGTADT
jgi:hypothetical protein